MNSINFALLLPIMLGGALGSGARFILVEVLYQPGQRFPLGILVVNTMGCFLIGLLITALSRHELFLNTLKPFLIMGFLAAFTTFSTFSYDTLQLVEKGNLGLAILNVVLSVALGVTAAWSGAHLRI